MNYSSDLSECPMCLCVCLQCHEACIAIYSSMENKKLLNWVIISVVSMFFCLLIYTLTGEFNSKATLLTSVYLCFPENCSSPPLSPGVYGFMTFGRAVASDILMSYPGNDVPMIISRLLFGISIITIYPIILLLGRWATAELRLSYKSTLENTREIISTRCSSFLDFDTCCTQQEIDRISTLITYWKYSFWFRRVVALGWVCRSMTWRWLHSSVFILNFPPKFPDLVWTPVTHFRCHAISCKLTFFLIQTMGFSIHILYIIFVLGDTQGKVCSRRNVDIGILTAPPG